MARYCNCPIAAELFAHIGTMKEVVFPTPSTFMLVGFIASLKMKKAAIFQDSGLSTFDTQPYVALLGTNRATVRLCEISLKISFRLLVG
jgi:hypothetical protein